jgi:hypothetical protein
MVSQGNAEYIIPESITEIEEINLLINAQDVTKLDKYFQNNNTRYTLDHIKKLEEFYPRIDAEKKNDTKFYTALNFFKKLLAKVTTNNVLKIESTSSVQGFFDGFKNVTDNNVRDELIDQNKHKFNPEFLKDFKALYINFSVSEQVLYQNIYNIIQEFIKKSVPLESVDFSNSTFNLGGWVGGWEVDPTDKIRFLNNYISSKIDKNMKQPLKIIVGDISTKVSASVLKEDDIKKIQKKVGDVFCKFLKGKEVKDLDSYLEDSYKVSKKELKSLTLMEKYSTFLNRIISFKTAIECIGSIEKAAEIISKFNNKSDDDSDDDSSVIYTNQNIVPSNSQTSNQQTSNPQNIHVFEFDLKTWKSLKNIKSANEILSISLKKNDIKLNTSLKLNTSSNEEELKKQIKTITEKLNESFFKSINYSNLCNLITKYFEGRDDYTEINKLIQVNTDEQPKVVKSIVTKILEKIITFNSPEEFVASIVRAESIFSSQASQDILDKELEIQQNTLEIPKKVVTVCEHDKFDLAELDKAKTSLKEMLEGLKTQYTLKDINVENKIFTHQLIKFT